ncbi:hypothetical protein [Demequina soli]|uniref:hypothetical protein n=1 Tax=Demequina soli TaxID=1638987 RepID=UPI0007803CE8|nr:hypothetical protein [Demequina soli]
MIAGQQPSAHQGVGPQDPLLTGVTKHGEGADPIKPVNRPWIALVGIVVVAIAAVLWWRVATNADDTAAREAAAAQGITVVEPVVGAVTVTETDDGFSIWVDPYAEGRSVLGGTGFDLVPTDLRPTLGDGWNDFHWSPDSEAFLTYEPLATLVVITPDHAWQITPADAAISIDPTQARQAFTTLRSAIDLG